MRSARDRRVAAGGLALAAALVAGVADLASAQPGGAASAARRPAATAAKPVATPAARAASAAAAGYAQRYATLCAACHGANGRSDIEGTPVLAGQPGFYSITQLFLFREGRRDNAAMTAIAKTLTDEDLRGFSAHIDTLPPVPAPPPATPPDPARMARGNALAQQHKCFFCHGNDFAGGQQVPRIAGQREEYLRASLRGFRSGQRPGYTQAMIGALSGIPVEDLDALAYYAARFDTK